MQSSKATLSSSISYHIKTVWLFTRSDLKTIAVPSTFFALIMALSGQTFESGLSPPAFAIARKLPRTAFWAWINLLPFDIENQIQEDSMVEDLENKPWRPLPSERISRTSAKRLMCVFYGVAILASSVLGGLPQCLTLIGLGYWYNNLGGGDNSYVVRNFINACGYTCFLSGASEVISTHPMVGFTSEGLKWFLIIGLVILTTIQAQDMADQLGDGVRARKTAPLVIGDSAARWTIAAGTALWSVYCPAYWHSDIRGLILPLFLGGVICERFLLKRNAVADKTSFRIYNAWIVSLFMCPLSRHIGIA